MGTPVDHGATAAAVRRARAVARGWLGVLHDPVFRLGVLPVHPFGFCVALGIVAGYALALWRAPRAGLPARYLPGMLVVVVLGAFIVARAGYAAGHADVARDGAQGVLAFWRGGLSLPAGLLGGLVLLAVYTWARRESLWRWADALAPSVALGLAIGMLGLPGGGEGWGQPTNGPFFMRVPVDALPTALLAHAARARYHFHPIWAYEAAFFAILLLVLLVVTGRRERPGARPAPDGTAALIFLFATMLGYGALRSLTLDASEPSRVLGTQLVCAAGAAIAAGLFVTRLVGVRAGLAITREIERVQAPSYQ